MQCVLAVDGGNTKTIALVAALDGTILGAGRGGCGDIYNARFGMDSSSIEVSLGDSSGAGLASALVAATLRDGLVPTPDSAAAAIANIEHAVISALQAAKDDVPVVYFRAQLYATRFEIASFAGDEHNLFTP